jgi:hypothetical protein
MSGSTRPSDASLKTIVSSSDPAAVIKDSSRVPVLPVLTASEQETLLTAVNAEISRVNTLLDLIKVQRAYITLMRGTYVSNLASLKAADAVANTQLPQKLSVILPTLGVAEENETALQRIYKFQITNSDLSITALQSNYNSLLVTLLNLKSLKAKLS